MLEHVLRGLVESAVVTHRKTGARAVITVAMETADPKADFNISIDMDHLYSACGVGEWKALQVKGDYFRYSVAYVQVNRYESLPTIMIDAPFKQFEIRFHVDTPHPNPKLAGRSRRTDLV